CFYSKKKYFYDKNIKISKDKNIFLTKIIEYFSFKNYVFYGIDSNIIAFLDTKLQKAKAQEKADLIILEQLNSLPKIDEIYHQMHNDSLLLIIEPYRKNYSFFNKIKQNLSFTVIIDTFDFALFFIRKEQLREFFIIRR
ncbi:MAG: hypothetical protein Q3983_07965, partial [Capnocytophaga sp.]|nr:hypothetical protein [Capnocytophaga sp.]